jgi:hypothetical protein
LSEPLKKNLPQSKSEKIIKSKSIVSKNTSVVDVKKKINLCDCSINKELKPELIKNSSELFFMLNDIVGINVQNGIINSTPRVDEQYSPIIINPLV